MKEKLEKGCYFPDFPVEDLEDNIRKQDVKEALHRGNHKSAEKHAAHLEKAISKEIKKGWNLLLLEEHAMQIPDLEISPMGVAEQLGVSETGEFVEKLRITHDLSFPGIISNESVNSRVRKEELEPIMFGHALLRIIHHIVHLRKRFPDKVIWLRKEDLKSAYRRMHLREQTAKRSVKLSRSSPIVNRVGTSLSHAASPFLKMSYLALIGNLRAINCRKSMTYSFFFSCASHHIE